jgi:hypothetical protein
MWRAILGKDVPDTRKKDIELLIRFFAMRDISGYKKPMKDFLTKFMKKNRNPSDEALVRSEDIFAQTCKAVVTYLGEKPFHIRAGLNASVFDSVMVAFSTHLTSIPKDTAKRYEKLIADQEFDKNTRQATTDEVTVLQRFKQADKILFG